MISRAIQTGPNVSTCNASNHLYVKFVGFISFCYTRPTRNTKQPIKSSIEFYRNTHLILIEKNFITGNKHTTQLPHEWMLTIKDANCFTDNTLCQINEETDKHNGRDLEIMKSY